MQVILPAREISKPTHPIDFPAGLVLQELGKEKCSQKIVENQTHAFLKSLNNVEMQLSEQINYLTQVSTGQPHEGSGYASAKVLQMAWHRIHHARSRIRELEESKNKYLQASLRSQLNRQQQNGTAASQAQPAPASGATAPNASSQPGAGGASGAGML
jgi:mediator of RNA polymerase II transcription subunit 11